MHKISVIITTHNRADLLPRAINSVLLQTRPANEILVVDDGSTDTTNTLMKDNRFASINYHRLPTPKGISHARNIGISKATGDWLAFLDDDDEWLPEKLHTQLNLISQTPNARAIHCNETWIRHDKPLKQKPKHQKHEGWILQHCLPLCCISPSAIILHRSVFQTIGEFDVSLPVCEDYDMWLRLCANYPIYLCKQALLKKYGGHPDQLSTKYPAMDRFRIIALDKLLRTQQLQPRDQSATIKMLLNKINIYLNGTKKHDNKQYVQYFTELKEYYSPKAYASKINLGKIKGFYQVDSLTTTSGQPTLDEFTLIKKAKFEIVINLSAPPNVLTHEENCLCNLGIQYVHYPIDFHQPTIDNVKTFFSLMDTYQNKRKWIHCVYNWRVSTLLFLYQTQILKNDRQIAYQALKKIWSPNQTWQALIQKVETSDYSE